jgi:hypothetical protein
VRGLVLALVILALGAASAWASGTPSPNLDEPTVFPLATGTYWIYRGPVKWTPVNSSEVNEQVLSWKMEVTETIQREHVLGAVLKGHPMDLAWYEEGKAPGDYLIVRVSGHQFYLLTGQRMEDALAKLRDKDDDLIGVVHDDELFLDLPLTIGKVFGEAFQITRQDGSYYWIVEGEEQVRLADVHGVPTGTTATEYQLAFLARTDSQRVGYVPGIGLTHYAYVHHGSVAEADLKLVEYHAGGGAQP